MALSQIWLQNVKKIRRYRRNSYFLRIWPRTVTLTLKIGTQRFCAKAQLQTHTWIHRKLFATCRSTLWVCSLTRLRATQIPTQDLQTGDGVAQLVERRTRDPKTGCLNPGPVRSTIKKLWVFPSQKLLSRLVCVPNPRVHVHPNEWSIYASYIYLKC